MVLAGLTGTLMLVFTLQAPFGFLADPRFAIAATLGASVLTMGSLSLTGLGAVLAPLVMFGGGLSRNTLLFYDLDEEREGRFLALQRAAQELKSGGLWYVAGGLPERHAGNPVKTSIKKGMPARVRTNVEPVRLDIGGQRLFMLPDGLWVEHDRKIRVVGWPEIQARVIGATAGFDMIEFGESKASGLTADLLLAGGGVEVLLRAEAAEAVHGVAMAIEGLRLGRDGGWDNPY
jgi:hypothetical protein